MLQSSDFVITDLEFQLKMNTSRNIVLIFGYSESDDSKLEIQELTKTPLFLTDDEMSRLYEFSSVLHCVITNHVRHIPPYYVFYQYMTQNFTAWWECIAFEHSEHDAVCTPTPVCEVLAAIRREPMREYAYATALTWRQYKHLVYELYYWHSVMTNETAAYRSRDFRIYAGKEVFHFEWHVPESQWRQFFAVYGKHAIDTMDQAYAHVVDERQKKRIRED